MAQHQRLCHFNQPLRFVQTLVIVDSLFSFEPILLFSTIIGNDNSKNIASFSQQNASCSTFEEFFGNETNKRSNNFVQKKFVNHRHPFSICALADISDVEINNLNEINEKSSYSSSSDETTSIIDQEITLQEKNT